MKVNFVSVRGALSILGVTVLAYACRSQGDMVPVHRSSVPEQPSRAVQLDTPLGQLTPQLIETVKVKHAADSFELITPYLKYCYPPMNEPVFEGFTLTVPAVLGNQELAKIGLVDVTAEPFNADSTGEKDSTSALQGAVNFARDHQMACFLPLGTYTISDTLECVQNLAIRDNGKIGGAAQYSCVLMGSRKQPGKRPVIRLADGAPGFNDPTRRKCAVLFWSRNYGAENRNGHFTEGPDMPQANIGFNQVFMGIDIAIGEDDGGAVGISMRAAEGSTIQDVTIDATHGDTGMIGASGSGGSDHNITVIGGRVGIDIRGFPPQYSQGEGGSQPGPTLTHVTLIHQSDKALILRAVGSLTAVGWKIVSAGQGPMIEVEDYASWKSCLGSASFIDSQFIFEKPGEKNTVFSIKRGIVLENVFVEKARYLVGDRALNPAGWSRISRMALPMPIGAINVHGVGEVDQVEDPYVDGVRTDHPYLEPITDAVPPQDLCSRHIWSGDFPSWETVGAVNVKEPPYNAKGDSVADDTQAIQDAIDEHEIVFLPKGYYRLTDTLKLKPHTKLIGLIHPFTVLMVRDAWGKLAATKPMPMVSSPDDPDADTTLAFLGISVSSAYDRRCNPAQTAGVYGLEWRAGARSMVRQVTAKFAGAAVAPEDATGVGFTYPWAHVTGHGGGRWYNFHVMERLCEFRPGYRHLLVENTSTPLAIYHLHAQHSMPEFGAELRHAANVSVYGCKQECLAKVSFMKISHCQNVRVFGLSGWAMPSPGKANFFVEVSDDFLIAGYAPFQETRGPTQFENNPWIAYPTGRTNIKDFFPIVEILPGGGEVKVSPFDTPLLYIRGMPSSR